MNLYKPHIFVLPEDRADRQIANGFLQTPGLNERVIQVLQPAGGWRALCDWFRQNHAPERRRYPEQWMVLVVDFDGKLDRRREVLEYVPEDLRDRVFVLGAFYEPENLKKTLGSYETIGKLLGEDCRGGTCHTWQHDFLKHNGDELSRMRSKLTPLLFPA